MNPTTTEPQTKKGMSKRTKTKVGVGVAVVAGLAWLISMLPGMGMGFGKGSGEGEAKTEAKKPNENDPKPNSRSHLLVRVVEKKNGASAYQVETSAGSFESATLKEIIAQAKKTLDQGGDSLRVRIQHTAWADDGDIASLRKELIKPTADGGAGLRDSEIAKTERVD